MNRNKLFVAIAITAITATRGYADGIVERFAYSPSPNVYAPHEFSLDLAGGYATRDKDGRNEDAAGLVAGVNYFLTDKIGVGADTYFDAFTYPYQLNFSGIFRYHIAETGFAPYGFAGFGRQWSHAVQWTGHFGGGLEFRLNTKTGVFIDGRYVVADKPDYGLWRFGFRFGF